MGKSSELQKCNLIGKQSKDGRERDDRSCGDERKGNAGVSGGA